MLQSHSWTTQNYAIQISTLIIKNLYSGVLFAAVKICYHDGVQKKTSKLIPVSATGACPGANFCT
jgi:hypothetical protein